MDCATRQYDRTVRSYSTLVEGMGVEVVPWGRSVPPGLPPCPCPPHKGEGKGKGKGKGKGRGKGREGSVATSNRPLWPTAGA